jgi:hypothetical protein
MPHQVWIFPILKGKNERNRTAAENGAKLMQK